MSKKEDSIAELSSLLEETRASVVAREVQIRHLEARVAAIEAAQMFPPQEAQTADEEDAIAEHMVEDTIADCEAGELRFEARQATRKMSQLVSERDQLQGDVLMMATDASTMLMDRVEMMEDMNDYRDELDEKNKELEEVKATLRAVKEENGRLSDVSWLSKFSVKKLLVHDVLLYRPLITVKEDKKPLTAKSVTLRSNSTRLSRN